MSTKRLNNWMRQAFVSSAMADVPREDYEEQARLLAKATIDSLMPEDEQQACKTLPAIANVVSDFVAAGWPKQQGATA